MGRSALFFAWLAFSAAGPALAATATRSAATRTKPAAALPPLLREVEGKYSKAATLTADFEQTTVTAATRQKKVSSGTIRFKRPGKIRWETVKPDKNLLVSDGQKFWFYTPPFDEGEAGQVMVRKSSQVQSRLAQSLLSASFSASAHSMTIHQDSPTEFTLVPKKGTAGDVLRARIDVDPAQKLITDVKLEHKGGNQSDIHLSKIELGAPLEDQLFKFVPPPNTEEVKE